MCLAKTLGWGGLLLPNQKNRNNRANIMRICQEGGFHQQTCSYNEANFHWRDPSGFASHCHLQRPSKMTQLLSLSNELPAIKERVQGLGTRKSTTTSWGGRPISRRKPYLKTHSGVYPILNPWKEIGGKTPQNAVLQVLFRPLKWSFFAVVPACLNGRSMA